MAVCPTQTTIVDSDYPAHQYLILSETRTQTGVTPPLTYIRSQHYNESVKNLKSLHIMNTFNVINCETHSFFLYIHIEIGHAYKESPQKSSFNTHSHDSPGLMSCFHVNKKKKRFSYTRFNCRDKNIHHVVDTFYFYYHVFTIASEELTMTTKSITVKVDHMTNKKGFVLQDPLEEDLSHSCKPTPAGAGFHSNLIIDASQ